MLQYVVKENLIACYALGAVEVVLKRAGDFATTSHPIIQWICYNTRHEGGNECDGCQKADSQRGNLRGRV